MITKNKLDKSFGSSGSSAGVLIFVAGWVGMFYLLYVCNLDIVRLIFGLVAVLIGALLGFTKTISTIDFDNKRIRFADYIFGVIPAGKWILIQPDMKIGVKKSKRATSVYSRSNRRLDMSNNDYRIVLLNSKGREIIPIQKFKDLEEAKFNLEELSKQLELRIF